MLSAFDKIREFTMIELLVVIAVIAILASLLLPGLNNARAMARASSCTGNLRQIGQAEMAYSTDFGGYLPPTWSSWSGFWIHQYNSYLGGVSTAIATSNCAKTAKPATCPEVPQMYIAFAVLNFWDTTGSVYFFGTGGRGAGKAYSLERIPNPTSLIYAVDAQHRADATTHPYDNVTGTGANALDERHPGLSSNYLFYDGHAGKYKWLQVYYSGWRAAAIP